MDHYSFRLVDPFPDEDPDGFPYAYVDQVKVNHAVHLQTVLANKECHIVDVILAMFTTWSKRSVTREELINDEELRIQVMYYTYMLYTHGILRLHPADIEALLETNTLHAGQMLFSALFYKRFRTDSKDPFKAIEANKDKIFIDRIIPLILYKTGSLDDKDTALLQQAYILIKNKFAGKTRSIRNHFGNEVTYLTHLKETMLSYLFFGGEDICVHDLLVTMLHDIIEDTDVDREALEKMFGRAIAYEVQQLSKKSPNIYLQEDKLDKTAIAQYMGLSEEKKAHFEQQEVISLIATAQEYIVRHESYKERRYTTNKKESIPERLIYGKYVYDRANNKIREDYYANFTKLTVHADDSGNVLIHRRTGEILIPGSTHNSENVYVLSAKKLITKKAADVLNNLGSMHDRFAEHKIQRKLDEAITYILPHVRRLSPESSFIRAIEYWITYRERYLQHQQFLK